MKKKEIYTLSDEEYEYLVSAVMHIYCPDLINHDCSLCPMNHNINHGFPKKPEYRCLLSMMEDRFKAIKATKEGEV